MLQFITILGISTFLSIAAYKIQHDEIQANKKLLLGSDITSSQLNQVGSLLVD